VAGLAIFTGCATSNDDVVDQRRCTQLRDHVVDLRLKGITDVDVVAHRAAFQQALGDDFIAKCQQSIEGAELTCMLDAADPTAVATCRRAPAARKL
jgi:hypothetical protein